MAEREIKYSLPTDCEVDGELTLPFIVLHTDLQQCGTDNSTCSSGKRKASAVSSSSSSSSDSYGSQCDLITVSPEQSIDDSNVIEIASFEGQIKNESPGSSTNDQLVDSLENLFLEENDQSGEELNTVEDNDNVKRDSDGDTKLHIVFIFMYFPYIRRMLRNKNITRYLNIQNDLFQTVLHLAVDNSIKAPFDIIKDLLRAGADPAMQDMKGRTALHIVCEHGDNKLLTALYVMHSEGDENGIRVQKGIRQCLNMHTYDGRTCLHIAVNIRAVSVVITLLHWGSDVNIKDRKSGRSALHFAAEAGDIEIVKILVNHPGVDISSKTYNKESPLILAYHRKHDDIVQLLVDRGAECNLHNVKNFGPVRRKFLKTKN